MSATQQSPQTRIIQAVSQKEPLSSEELRRHMLATYYYLRWIQVSLAIALPIFLVVVGQLLGVGLLGSMSAYYHSHPLLRDVFVGTLCAIGVSLILYRGYSIREDWALNFAGMFSILVALFPMELECGDTCQPVTMHGFSAFLFFGLAAYVCVFLAKDTLKLVPNERQRQRYANAYNLLGVLMIAIPVGIYVIFAANVFSSNQLAAEQIRRAPNYGILAAEAVAFWIFGAYWIVKSIEIRTTHSEDRAVSKELQQTGVGVQALPGGGEGK
jgi:hypothetical protein